MIKIYYPNIKSAVTPEHVLPLRVRENELASEQGSLSS